MLPKLYRAAKTDTAKKASTEQSLASTREEEEEREGQQQEQRAEQEVEIDLTREISNTDTYVNQQEFIGSTDPLTPNEEVNNDDENFYENNPLAWRYFTDTEKQEEKGEDKGSKQDQDQDSTRDYVNKEMFTQPPPQDTELPSNGIDANDEELYVNNLLARKKLKNLHLYNDNEKPDISTTTNRAYGVTERSDNLSKLMQQHGQQAQDQSEINGEDEYMYVEVNEESPEEEYEEMATFKTPKFTKKQQR